MQIHNIGNKNVECLVFVFNNRDVGFPKPKHSNKFVTY